MDWQSIATAPRDGRKLVMWTPQYGGQPFIDWLTFNGETGKQDSAVSAVIRKLEGR